MALYENILILRIYVPMCFGSPWALHLKMKEWVYLRASVLSLGGGVIGSFENLMKSLNTAL